MCGLTDYCKTQIIKNVKKNFIRIRNETKRREEKKKFFFFFFFFVLRSFCVRMKMQNENDGKMVKIFMSFLKVKIYGNGKKLIKSVLQ